MPPVAGGVIARLFDGFVDSDGPSKSYAALAAAFRALYALEDLALLFLGACARYFS